MSNITTLEDITNKINKIHKIFANPNITFFIVMLLVLLISCYSFVSDPIKNTLAYILSNPIVILFSICTIIIIAYFNINIGVLLLILFFICIYGANTNINTNTNKIMEHFSDKPSKLDKMKDDEKKVNDQVKSIKDTILTTFNKFKDVGSSDYKEALLENKKKQFESEKNNNSKKTSSNKTEDTFDNIQSNKSNKPNNKSNKKQYRKDKFQTIDTRTFDPTNEDDTNLLITKEILQDIINRIEYDYETSKYLRKYIKHRIEEIIEINKLTDDD